MVRLRLEDRPIVRIGWGILAVVLLAAAGVTALGLVGAGPSPALLGLTAFAFVYLWFATGAIRMARLGSGELRADDDRLILDCPALFAEPVVVPRDGVDYAAVDPRPLGDRRVAARVRKEARGRSTFHDHTWPVLSVAPSAHWDPGGAATPNLTIDVAPSVEAPKVPWSARLLLRVSGGRHGHYRGPRSGKGMPGLRFVVADPEAARTAFEGWGVFGVRDRDRRYLEPVTDDDRKEARRDRLLTVGVFVGLLAGVFVISAIARACG